MRCVSSNDSTTFQPSTNGLPVNGSEVPARSSKVTSICPVAAASDGSLPGSPHPQS